ncbi:ABC transporter permease [Roseimarinus sediminis]|uniref:ABC transporter permease n=1 Tax=Roseimarinus sediminis TaxID=1610899 RepID=UPI003D1E4CD2
MTKFKLVLQSIRHYLMANLFIAAGVAITTAVITGGLIVGDSVNYSLEKTVHLRLGEISHALNSGDRYFTTALSQKLRDEDFNATAVLKQEALASTDGGRLSLSKVNVWGLDEHFDDVAGIPGFTFNNNEVAVSTNMAVRLNLESGDEVVLRIEKASLIPANAPFVSDENQTVSFRARVSRILSDEELGRLSLHNSQTAPFNVFMSLDQLNALMELNGNANLILLTGKPDEEAIRSAVSNSFSLADASLELIDVPATDEWELRSQRVFIDDAVRRSVENSGLQSTPILTYFTNYFRFNGRETPYSFVSTVPDSQLAPGEIIINSWLADDLQLAEGDSLETGYFNIGPLRELTESSRSFLVKKVVEIEGAYADRSLMPRIPGLSDSESCSDWQTGVPVNLKAIRDKDEAYWYEYRGLPKAFVAYSTARELWANRYGSFTALRFARSEGSDEMITRQISEQLDPFLLGFQLQSVKEEGLSAARNGTDFTQLFIGLSFFILLAGVILTALLFRLNLEKRQSEIATLSAMGFTGRRIQMLFLSEGLLIAVAGALPGLLLAVLYNRMVFWGLNHVWNDIVRTSVLVPKIETGSLLTGFLLSVLVALLTVAFSLRSALKKNTAALQRKAATIMSRRSRIILHLFAWLALAYALLSVLLEVQGSNANLDATAFFVAGGALLLAFVLLFWLFLTKETGETQQFNRKKLVFENIRLSPSRSLTVVLLLAMGTYLVVSTGMNRKDLFSTAGEFTSGTGGFLYWAETTVPVLHQLNNEAYRREQGFSVPFTAVQMRVAEGDDASCLNLNRVSNPRILGLDATQLKGRFAIQSSMENVDKSDFWQTLKKDYGELVPAIADQTVLQWGLGKKVGDTLSYSNALGEEVKLLLVAGLKASVFQGNVIVDNAHFLKHFPTSSGSKVMLIDGDREQKEAIASDLELIYRDFGLALTEAPVRLARFMSITNTYLAIFLVLGALGLLIGTIGLAIVLQRSLLERKAEFALLSSIGFQRSTIRNLVIIEYLLLLVMGLLIGLVTALVSVYPVIAGSLSELSVGFVLLLIAAIMLNGMIWIVLLANSQLKKLRLIEALRND